MSPLVVVALSSVMVTVGRVVSTTRVWVVAALVLPAASREVTETELEPLASIARVPETGVAEPVSMLQVPVVAVVE